MRPRFTPAWLAVGLAAVIASGCGSSNPAAPITTQTDEAQVNATLTAAASLVDDNLTESTLKGSATSEVAAITPYKWWQTVTGVTKSWTLAFADTDGTGHPNTCRASLVKHVTGQLVIVPQSDTTSTITKPLDKTLTRGILLQRMLINGNHLWKVVEVTGAFVTTPPPNNTSHIVSIRVVATGVDTTLTDATSFFSLKHIIRFAPSDTVHLTVTTTRNTDPVFIHLNGIYRWRLHNNLDNTYSTKWATSALSGWRHFGIQVMTRASLYDDAAAFDTQAWHFPFRVTQGDVNYYP